MKIEFGEPCFITDPQPSLPITMNGPGLTCVWRGGIACDTGKMFYCLSIKPVKGAYSTDPYISIFILANTPDNAIM